MPAPQAVTATVRSGEKSLTTVYRGTEYFLARTSHGFELMTNRLALGNRMGGYRRFASLAELVQACPAFGTEADLITAFYGLRLPRA